MTTSEIVTLVVSSSVLSAILTSLINLKIQDLNYKRDYYKKIIERRINAQEEIIKLSNELRVRVKLDNGKLCNRICAAGEDHFSSFLILIAISVNHSFWLSSELSGILLEFNVFLLNEIDHEIKRETHEERNKKLEFLGIKQDEKIREYRKRIDHQLMKDFSSLENVKSFVNSKRFFEDKLYWLKK